MPRKDQKGRPPKTAIKKMIAELRDSELSFAEIGKELGITRQLAQYHWKEYIKGRTKKGNSKN